MNEFQALICYLCSTTSHTLKKLGAAFVFPLATMLYTAYGQLFFLGAHMITIASIRYRYRIFHVRGAAH